MKTKFILTFVLSLFTGTVLAQEPENRLGVQGLGRKQKPTLPIFEKKEEEKPVNPPPSTPAPAADPGAATPPPAEKPAVSCDLPPLALPQLFTNIVAKEVIAIKANEILIRKYSELSQAYTAKKADYQACLLRGGGCGDPGPGPKEPKLTPSPMQNLNKVDLMGKLGAWLVCVEIRRTFAREACLAGNSAQMSTLETDLKSACPFQSVPTKLRGFMGQN